MSKKLVFIQKTMEYKKKTLGKFFYIKNTSHGHNLAKIIE